MEVGMAATQPRPITIIHVGIEVPPLTESGDAVLLDDDSALTRPQEFPDSTYYMTRHVPGPFRVRFHQSGATRYSTFHLRDTECCISG